MKQKMPPLLGGIFVFTSNIETAYRQIALLTGIASYAARSFI
jgi:hypothetical protein